MKKLINQIKWKFYVFETARHYGKRHNRFVKAFVTELLSGLRIHCKLLYKDKTFERQLEEYVNEHLHEISYDYCRLEIYKKLNDKRFYEQIRNESIENDLKPLHKLVVASILYKRP